MRRTQAAVLLASIVIAAVWLTRRETSNPTPIDAAPPAPRARVARPTPPATPLPTGDHRCRIFGTVFVDGRPGTASIELRRNGDAGSWRDDPTIAAVAPAASAATSADGAFAFAGLAPGSYRIDVSSDADRAASTTVELDAEGAVDREDLHVVADAKGETLRGRVLDVDAAPFDGWLRVDRGPAGRRRGADWVRADAEGRFSIARLGTGWGQLKLSRGSGSEIPGPKFTTPCAAPLEVRLADSMRMVEVRVVDGDAPVAGANVRFESRLDEIGDPRTKDAETTDATGVAWITVPKSEPCDVEVDAPDRPRSRDSLAANQSALVVTMHATAPATARVVDAATGAPAVGAVVWAATGEPNPYVDRSAGAGPHGVATLRGLPPAELRFRVAGGGWFSAEIAAEAARGLDSTTRVPWTGAPDVRDAAGVVELRAVRARAVRGHVLSSTGEPVVGAVVETFAVGGLRAMGDSWRWPRVATDADGRFVADGLPSGATFKFVATCGWCADRAQSEAVVAAEPPSEAEIRFPRGGFVNVEVRDADTGAPIVGADAWCRRPKVKGPLVFIDLFDAFGRSAITDATGRARVGPVTPGAYDVGAKLSGFSRGPLLRVVPSDLEGDAAKTFVVELRRGARIEGHVVARDGKPATDAKVYFAERDEDSVFSLPDFGDPVGPNGEFAIDDLEPGEYVVSAIGRDGSATVRAVAGGDSVEIRLAQPNTSEPEKTKPVDAPVPRRDARPLEFRVVGPRGEMVESALVETTRGAASVSNGVGRLTGASAGARLLIRGPLGESGESIVAGATFVEIAPDADQLPPVRLAPARVVHGRATDEAGRPVADVRVVARPDVLRGDGARDDSAVSDAHGDLAFERLGAFAYSLQVQAPSGFRGPGWISIDATTLTVEFRCEHAVPLLVEALDESDRPLAGANVEIRPDDATCSYWEIADASGVAHFHDVGSATKRWIFVHLPGLRDDLLPLRDDASAASTRTVRLSRAVRVAGVVVDWTGAPVSDVSVRGAPVGDENPLMAQGRADRTDVAGRFAFRALGDGPIRIAAGNYATHVTGVMDSLVSYGIDESGALDRDATTFPADGADVRIALRRDRCIEVRLVGWPAGRELPEPPTLVTTDGKHRHDASIRGDKPLLFSGLDPSREYVFLTRLPNRNLVGYAAGLRPGQSTDVRLEPGRVLSGRIRAPSATVESVGVEFAIAGGVIRENVAADGTFRIPCLPAATGELTASAGGSGDTWYQGRTTAAPGDEITLELTQTHYGK